MHLLHGYDSNTFKNDNTNMGNCLGSPVVNKSPSSTGISTTPGASKNNTNENGFSESTSGNSKYSTNGSLEEVYPDGQILPTPSLKVFTFAELKSATRNFKPDNVLGEGGFGKVFKGNLDEKTHAPSKVGSGMIVDVKKLNSESMQGFEEWQVSPFFGVKDLAKVWVKPWMNIKELQKLHMNCLRVKNLR